MIQVALFFAYSFVLMAVVSGHQAQSGCQPVFYYNMTDALQTSNKGIFSPAQFTKQCMAAACPALIFSPCPYLSGSTNKTYNVTAEQIILETISSCLQNQTFLCSISIQDIPDPCDTAITIFNSPQIIGNITLIPGTGSMSGIPFTVFAFDPSTGNFGVNMTLVYKGSYDGFLGLPGNDNGILQLENVNTTSMVKMGLVMAIYPANMSNPVTVVSNNVSAQMQFGDLFPNNNISQEYQANLTAVLKEMVNQALQDPTYPEVLGTFIGDIIAKASLTAEDNCPM